MKRAAILACLILLPLQSCFMMRQTVNEPLVPDLVGSLKPGMTAVKVVELMGAPAQVVQLGKRSAYEYRYQIGKGVGSLLIVVNFFNEDTRTDRVWVFFDENQVVTHVGSTFSSHRTQFAIFPFSDIYDAEDAKAADAERGIR